MDDFRDKITLPPEAEEKLEKRLQLGCTGFAIIMIGIIILLILQIMRLI